MTRIIPWTLPPVKGGSIGGYTPQPTPTPVSNDPYDLSEITTAFSLTPTSLTYDQNSSTVSYLVGAVGNMTISGVKINNTVEVGSVMAKVHISGNVVYGWTNGSTVTQTATITEGDYLVSLGPVMTAEGGSAQVIGQDYVIYGGRTVYNIIPGSHKSGSGTVTYYTKTPTIQESSTVTFELVSIVVYNANGVPLQEWMPE